MKLPRRQFLHLVAAAVALSGVSRVAWAQAYPTRPVRIIAPAAAGTAMDVHGRLHGQWLSERLGQPFIVENRPGAASTIGAAEAIRSRPDGYTLFLLPISLAITASLYEKLPYNIIRDTTPIALFYKANYVMVVNPSLPVTSVAEFIAHAKANPGKVNMGSQGIGSIGHLAGELFKSMTGIEMVHVPYRSVALALADVVSGQVQVQFATSTDSIPQIRSSPSSIVPRGTSFHRSVELECPSIGLDAARFLCCCCCGLFSGPAELGAVNPYAVHDHGQSTRQGHNRLFQPAAPGDLHRPGLEP